MLYLKVQVQGLPNIEDHFNYEGSIGNLYVPLVIKI